MHRPSPLSCRRVTWIQSIPREIPGEGRNRMLVFLLLAPATSWTKPTPSPPYSPNANSHTPKRFPAAGAMCPSGSTLYYRTTKLGTQTTPVPMWCSRSTPGRCSSLTEPGPIWHAASFNSWLLPQPHYKASRYPSQHKRSFPTGCCPVPPHFQVAHACRGSLRK